MYTIQHKGQEHEQLYKKNYVVNNTEELKYDVVRRKSNTRKYIICYAVSSMTAHYIQCSQAVLHIRFD